MVRPGRLSHWAYPPPEVVTAARVGGAAVPLAEPMSFNGAAVQVSASIGVAVHPVHGSSPDVLCKAADVALYEAKRAGRDTWRWYGEMAVPSAAGVPAEDLAGT